MAVISEGRAGFYGFETGQEGYDEHEGRVLDIKLSCVMSVQVLSSSLPQSETISSLNVTIVREYR